jgi:hypothetical protein
LDDFSGAGYDDIFVNDNSDFGGDFEPLDMVTANLATFDDCFLDVLMGTETALDSITDETVLPGIGTEFDHDLTVSEISDVVFQFELPSSDDLPDGARIAFESLNNGTFKVVPEPSAITLWCLAAGLGCVIWRRRRAV